jgi:hypothetical protein
MVPMDQFDQALQLFESLSPQPVDEWGNAPVWLAAYSEFQLLSPQDGQTWPGQDPVLFGGFETPAGVKLGVPSVRLNLHARMSMGLSLSIPEATDEQLMEIIPWLQANLPFRLSAKHWTRWTLARNAKTYRGERIYPL